MAAPPPTPSLARGVEIVTRLPFVLALLLALPAAALAQFSSSSGPPITGASGDVSITSNSIVTVTGANGAIAGTAANANQSAATGVVCNGAGTTIAGDIAIFADTQCSVADGGPLPFLLYRAGFNATNDVVATSAIDFAPGVATNSTGTASLTWNKPAATTFVGTVSSGATSGTVASAAGLAPGTQVTLAGAGAASANLTTYLTAVSGTTVTWKTATSTTVTATAFTPTGACVVDLTVSGAGGLDTGSATTSTTYHYMIIAGTGKVSTCMASLSPTSPSPPTGYGAFRRLISMNTQSGSAIPLVFLQANRRFTYMPPINDVASVASSITAANFTLGSIPTGIVVQPFFYLGTSAASGETCYTPLGTGQTDMTPSAASTTSPGFFSANNGTMIPILGLSTDTGAHVRCVAHAASGNWLGMTYGFEDPQFSL